MKVIVTKVTEIVGKDGREWTKLDFVAATGDVGTVMYQRGKFNITQDIDMSEIADRAGTSVEFDQRGRLVSVA